MTSSPFTFVSEKVIEAFQWKNEQSTVQWCKENIYLNQDVTPHTGMISFEKTPWIEEILNDWDKAWIEIFNIMASTQVGKTTIEFCCISKELDTDPCMMQLTIPTDDGVADFVKTKFDPFFRGIKSLQQKMSLHKEEEKSRFKSALKEVPNGMLFILGNTDKNRRSKTVKNLFNDEVALFGKGHVKELIGRTKFFEKTGRKIFNVSSRKFPGDEIEVQYSNSYCKKELQIKCKGCGEFFYPSSTHFKYLTEEEYKRNLHLEKIENMNDYKRAAVRTAGVVHECGYKTTDKDIEDLVREKNVKLVIVEGEDSDSIHGYKLNALATGLTKYSTIAEALIEAGEDDIELQTIYQDYFNETYEIKFEEMSKDDILLIGNDLSYWDIPEGTYKIYMGVDTQKDHFWYEIKAFCYGNISHTIAWGRAETFAELEDIWIAGQNIQHNGEYYQIAKMGIDRRGYNEEGYRRTDEVDAFVEYMVSKYKIGDENRVYVIEGEPKITGDKPYKILSMRQRAKENNVKSWQETPDIKVIKMSNLYMKSTVQRAIERTIELKKGEEEHSSNLFYVNQDTIDSDMEKTTSISYTRQITSEVYDYARNPKTGRLDSEKSWFMPKKTDNHIFDTSCICYTFAQIDNISLKKVSEIKNVAETLNNLSIFE